MLHIPERTLSAHCRGQFTRVKLTAANSQELVEQEGFPRAVRPYDDHGGDWSPQLLQHIKPFLLQAELSLAFYGRDYSKPTGQASCLKSLGTSPFH